MKTSKPPVALSTRMVLLSYFAYFFYYFTRKHLGITTNALIESGYSENLIVLTQTGYGICYAVGQFMSGALGDRLGPRIALATGMILSALASLAFGIFPFMGVLAIGMTLNGLFQSTGWPNACKVVAQWVQHRHRGRVMGVWMTCYIFGSLLANITAGYILGHYGWRYVFLVTGAIVIVVGIAQAIFLINKPEDAGYSINQRHPSNKSGEKDTQSSFMLMIRQPTILLLGVAYSGQKFIRYTLFAWLPYYLSSSIMLSNENSAYVSNGFEVGGIIGLIIGGVIGDKYFSENKTRLAFFSLLAMIGALFFYLAISKTGGIGGNALGLACVGFFLYIADSIVSGTAAQDLGGADNTASAAGIINGIGSLAQPLAGFVPIWLKDKWGWDAVFICFICVAIFSSLVLLPVALKKQIHEV